MQAPWTQAAALTPRLSGVAAMIEMVAGLQIHASPAGRGDFVIHIDHSAEGVATITIDRGPVNALDPASIVALSTGFRTLAENPPAKGILLTGAGNTFCAGVDVRAFSALDHAARIGMARSITAMMTAVFMVPCPLVALINGHALGGGLILALGADWRIAVDDPDVKLGLLEAKAGVPFPSGPMAIMRHLLPGNLARQWALSSRTLAPAEMVGHAVVEELCSYDQLFETGLERITRLAAQPGYATVKKQLLEPLLTELQNLTEAGSEPFWETTP